ncbi:MAG TPA: alkaline phosphatase, partial [Planctomycetaceae bacterium]|nr:alkaline phosphatase [Planctomycetaceae bacterium]
LVEAGLEFKKFEPEFLVCLGDLIDAAADVETELGYLTRIVKEFDK